MRICHIGLNHRTAPLDLRERLAVSEAEIPAIIRAMVEQPAVREAVLYTHLTLPTFYSVEFRVVAVSLNKTHQ